MLNIFNDLKNTKLVICDSYHYVNIKQIQKSFNFKLLKLEVDAYKCKEIFITNKLNNNNDNILLVFNIITGLDLIKLLLVFYNLNNNLSNITLLIPYLGYCRQHNDTNSVGSMILESIKNFKIKKIHLLEPHCIRIFHNLSKYSNINIISPRELFIRYIQTLNLNLNIENSILISPDKGFENEIKYYSKILNIDYIVGKKIRNNQGKIEKLYISFNEKFKNILIIDDLIDTGDTITTLIKKLTGIKKNNLSIFVFCCHGVLSKKPEFLKYKCVKELILTNSLEVKYKNSKIKILDIYSQ